MYVLATTTNSHHLVNHNVFQFLYSATYAALAATRRALQSQEVTIVDQCCQQSKLRPSNCTR